MRSWHDIRTVLDGRTLTGPASHVRRTSTVAEPPGGNATVSAATVAVAPPHGWTRNPLTVSGRCVIVECSVTATVVAPSPSDPAGRCQLAWTPLLRSLASRPRALAARTVAFGWLS